LSPLKFKLAKINTDVKLDNNIQSNDIQPFKSNLGQLQLPEIGAFIKTGFKDVLENYNLYLNYKLPNIDKGNLFKIAINDKSHKNDIEISFTRAVTKIDPQVIASINKRDNLSYPIIAKNILKKFEIAYKIPINYQKSIFFN